MISSSVSSSASAPLVGPGFGPHSDHRVAVEAAGGLGVLREPGDLVHQAVVEAGRLVLFRLPEGHAGVGRHVAVAGGVDHDLRVDGLAAALVLDDDAAQAALAVLDHAGVVRVKENVDAGVAHHLEHDELEPLGVVGEVVREVALGVAALFRRVGVAGLDRRPVGEQAQHQLLADALCGLQVVGLDLVAEADDVRHQAGRGGPAEKGKALDDQGARPVARRRYGRGKAGDAASDDDDVVLAVDVDLLCGLLVPADALHAVCSLCCLEGRSARARAARPPRAYNGDAAAICTSHGAATCPGALDLAPPLCYSCERFR